MAALAELGLDVKIWTTPVEIPDPIPFEQDRSHASYDAEAAHRFWLILAWVDEVFKEFRTRFIGKLSPVHFCWGSFDLAVTRVSGRPRARAVGRRRHYSRSLLARSDQRWVLARWRRHQGARLYLHGAAAARLRGAAFWSSHGVPPSRDE